jgi:hypothetical protein
MPKNRRYRARQLRNKQGSCLKTSHLSTLFFHSQCLIILIQKLTRVDAQCVAKMPEVKYMLPTECKVMARILMPGFFRAHTVLNSATKRLAMLLLIVSFGA